MATPSSFHRRSQPASSDTIVATLPLERLALAFLLGELVDVEAIDQLHVS
jgi:hypothetical protein